jgi:hypothetical protein
MKSPGNPIDGKSYHMFEDCEFEPLSWIDVEGSVGYANKYRVTKKTPDGELDITITRDKHAGLLASPEALFVTGFVETTGFLEWKGVRYEVKSRSIGSAAVLS